MPHQREKTVCLGMVSVLKVKYLMELMLKLCCGEVLLTSSVFPPRVHGTWHFEGLRLLLD